MSGWAYYNEIDLYAAAWLRNLIDAGLIAPGVVDTRSIVDVRPEDLRGFSQCHFFAGIGVWSYALRRAGWPDDRPVWTGSCPCQPFSAAGKGGGFADERHLWPYWHHLIRECRPASVFGEQVASKDADPWVDLVQTDLEALGYAVGAVPFPAASVGAPHIRDRLYWVAHGGGAGLEERECVGRVQRAALGACEGQAVECGCDACLVGNAECERSGRDTGAVPCAQGEAGRGVRGVADGVELASAACELADNDIIGRIALPRRRLHDAAHHAEPCGATSWMADADGGHPGAERQQRSGEQRQQSQDGGTLRLVDSGRAVERVERAGPTNGLWRDADWIRCRDGKRRPVEPGTFPLAHGAPSRVGRLRAYGNAIVAEQAQVFIECVMGAFDE